MARSYETALPASRRILLTEPHEVIAPGLTVVGNSASNRQEMRELLDLAATGRIKGVIFRRPFSQINEAIADLIADLIAGRVDGRTVLDME